MKMLMFLSLGVVFFTLSVMTPFAAETGDATTSEAPIYTHTMANIDGEDVSLADFKGDVLLLVNVASKCGYTPQYEGLEKLYQRYKDQGLVVMGFPANNFGNQEPGTNAEIKEFCTTKFDVTFPMFAKISVKGDDIHPLYQYLTDKKANSEFSGEIGWNFTKFLVNRDGEVVARFASADKPMSDSVIKAVEAALNAK